MRPKILLIGKNGQVGAELSRLLPELGEVVAAGRNDMDLTKPVQIREFVRRIRPNLIVNSAAYTAVDQAETEPTTARAVNAEAPSILADEGKKIGAAIVHYSTDYVFDGSHKTLYDEFEPTCPLNVYGQTKLEGEIAVKASGIPHLIFRVAWIYGTRGRNFLLTILRLASEREELRIVQDQIGAPTWSREIAKATVRVLTQSLGQKADCERILGATGTFNLTAGGETSWFSFAKAIVDEARQYSPQPAWMSAVTKGNPLKVRGIKPISTAEYPTPARRPAYSVLSSSRFEAAFGFRLPDWRSQLNSVFVQG